MLKGNCVENLLERWRIRKMAYFISIHSPRVFRNQSRRFKLVFIGDNLTFCGGYIVAAFAATMFRFRRSRPSPPR